MIKGIIFDIDGILVDSEPLHAATIIESVKIITGKSVEFKPENLVGLSLDETLEKLEINRNCIDELKKIMSEYYLEHLKKSMVRQGIEELWKSLLIKNIPFGCVSSAEMKICRGNVGLIEIPFYSEIPVISCECVSHTKPHPMPYVEMLKRLGLVANEVIVLEDSDVGITSAKAAGIDNVFAWPHRLSKSQSYKDAKKVIKDIREVPYIQKVLT